VQFERQQSFNEAQLTRCPECSKKTLRKVYTPVGIVFKGSGFYATDHRSPSGAGRATNAAKSTDGESKTSTPGETTNSSSSEGTNTSESKSSSSDSKE